MNANRYLALLEVARLGNFTKAAQSMGCSQSAVSQAIKSLEDELDCTLLKRTRGNTSLTDQGRELLPFIRQLYMDYDQISRAASSLKDANAGTLIIASVPSLAATLLPDLISDFKRNFQGISYTLLTDDSPGVLQAVRSGKADLGLCFTSGSAGADAGVPAGATASGSTADDNDASLHLFDSQLSVATPKNLFPPGSLGFSELAPLSFIDCGAFEEASHMENLLREAGLRLGQRDRVSDPLAAFSLIEKGLSCGFFCGDYSRFYGEKLDFHPLSPQVSLPVYLIQDHQRPLAPTAAAFSAMLRGLFGK